MHYRSVLTALPLLLATLVQAEDWPQWRGPTRTGFVSPSARVPDRLPVSPRQVWKLSVGASYGSPVVSGGQVFHVDAQNGKEVLHALEAATGKELWQAATDDTTQDTQGPAAPRGTPVVDAERVYTVSCKGELQCRSTKDGALLWHLSYTNDLGAVFIGERGTAPGAMRHGNNGSPLVIGPHLYACAGGTNGAGVVCLDKLTGKVVWKSQNDQAGYSGPILGNPGGIPQLICYTVEGLISLAPDTGQLQWRFPVKTSYARHVTTPVWADDVVVVGSHQAGLLGFRVTPEAGAARGSEAWVNKDLGINFMCPVVVGKHLYGLGPEKNFMCVEMATGRLVWSKDGYFSAPAERAHAGLIVMKNHILALTDGGELVMFAADPTAFKEVSRVQVAAANWCNPAYADGKLYLRDGIKGTGELQCLDLLAE